MWLIASISAHWWSPMFWSPIIHFRQQESFVVKNNSITTFIASISRNWRSYYVHTKKLSHCPNKLSVIKIFDLIITVRPFYVEIEAIDVVIELFTYNFMECGTILLI